MHTIKKYEQDIPSIVFTNSTQLPAIFKGQVSWSALSTNQHFRSALDAAELQIRVLSQIVISSVLLDPKYL